MHDYVVQIQQLRDQGDIDLIDTMRLAAISRWFDIRLLRRLLPDRQSTLWRLLHDIQELPFVFPGPVTESWRFEPDVRAYFLELISPGERIDGDTAAFNYFEQQFTRFAFFEEEGFVYLVEKFYHQFRLDADAAYSVLDIVCGRFFQLHQLDKIPPLLVVIEDVATPRANLFRKRYEADLQNRRGENNWREVERMYFDILESEDAGDTLKIKVTMHLAKLYTNLTEEETEGRKEKAFPLYQQALFDAERRQEKRLAAIILQNRGNLYGGNGDIDQAIKDHEEALARLQSLLDKSAPLDTGPQRAQLLHLIVASFNLAELETLCFELGISFEDFGTNSPTKATEEIILYMERRGDLSVLIQKCQQLRPRRQWDVISASESLDELSPEEARPFEGQPEYIKMLSEIYQVDLCSIWNDLANDYLDKYRATRNMDYIRKAEELLYRVTDKAPRVNDNEGLAFAFATLADVYNEIRDLRLALDFWLKAWDIASHYTYTLLLRWLEKILPNIAEAVHNNPQEHLSSLLGRAQEVLANHHLN